MRPIGTARQLAARRERVLRLLQRGHAPAELAEVIGVTLRSIQRWRRAAYHPRAKRLQSRRSACRPCRLTAQPIERLRKALLKSARAYGYAEDYWTLARIADLIWKLFGVRYTPSGVWHLLRRMRWSCQKPQRVAFQHDDQAMAHWTRYVWPWIKKVARPASNADIH
jgi:transposase